MYSERGHECQRSQQNIQYGGEMRVHMSRTYSLYAHCNAIQKCYYSVVDVDAEDYDRCKIMKMTDTGCIMQAVALA